MNFIYQIDQEYLSPNKTIEKLNVSSNLGKSVFYVYNYKGNSFRVFISKEELDGFWDGVSEEHRHFQTETELDEWLNSLIIL